MKRMMLAGVAALALCTTALADDWFNAQIEDYTPTTWPEGYTAVGGDWVNPEDAQLTDTPSLTFSIAADQDPLTFKATEAKSAIGTEDGEMAEIIVSSTVKFTPFAPDAIPDVPEDCKGGLIVVGAEDAYTYWYVAAGEDGNEWIDSSVSAENLSELKSVEIRLYNDNGAGDSVTITYTVDAVEIVTETNITLADDAKVQDVCLTGDGEISSLSATAVQPTPAPVGPTSDDGSFSEPDPSTGAVTFTPNAGATTAAIELNGFAGRVIIPADKVETVTGVPAEQLLFTVKGVPVDAKYFVGGDESGFSTALSDEAKPPFAEETPFKVGEETSVTVKTVPGLTYELKRDADLKGGFAVVVDKKIAEGESTELKDAEPPAEKGFYKVEASKKDVE